MRRKICWKKFRTKNKISKRCLTNSVKRIHRIFFLLEKNMLKFWFLPKMNSVFHFVFFYFHSHSSLPPWIIISSAREQGQRDTTLRSVVNKSRNQSTAKLDQIGRKPNHAEYLKTPEILKCKTNNRESFVEF